MLIKYRGTLHLLGRRRAVGASPPIRTRSAVIDSRSPKKQWAIPPRRTRRMTPEDFTRRMSQEFPSVPELAVAEPAVRETFVRIPEGWFQMGSEDGPEDAGPVHRVWVDGSRWRPIPSRAGIHAGFCAPLATNARAAGVSSRSPAIFRSSASAGSTVRRPAAGATRPMAAWYPSPVSGNPCDSQPKPSGARRARRRGRAAVSLGRRDSRLDSRGRARSCWPVRGRSRSASRTVRSIRHRREHP